MITQSLGSVIDPTATISDDVDVIMGDCSYIGPHVNIVGNGTLKLGDYCKIHRFTFVNCYNDITLGHNVWVGERAVLDGTANLILGNNVGVGIGTAIYTHGMCGDTFSGCRIKSSKTITIYDEAWMMGASIVQASDIAYRVLVLPGSNVTRLIDKPNSIWSGNPVQNVTDLMGGPPWIDVSVEQKLKKFEQLLKKYELETRTDWHETFVPVVSLPLIHERCQTTTYFDVDRRVYTKQRTSVEQAFIKWLLKHNKAKFLPAEI